MSCTRRVIPRVLGLLLVAGSSLLLAGCSELGFEPELQPEPTPPTLSARRVQPVGPGAVTEQWGAARCAERESSSFRFIDCVSGGEGAPGFLASARPIEPAIDVRGHTLRTWVRVDDVRRLAGLELRLASSGFEAGYAAFGVPLYDDGPFNLIQGQVWTPLTFSLGAGQVQGEVDLSTIRQVGLYFADRGEGSLGIAWSGLDAVETMAQGFVSFTFDDGTDEHAQIAAPAMQRFGFRGTAYVMPDQVGGKGFVTPEELVELRDVYGWDVAAHHGLSFTDLGRSQLESTLLGVRRYLDLRGFERGSPHLAYPLGRQDPLAVRPLVRKHFATARIAGGGPETIPPADPHLLRAVNVLDTTTPEELGAIAARARDHGEWAILMFHLLTEEPSLEIEYRPRDFDRALEAIAATGVEVLPVSEVWEKLRGLQVKTGPASSGVSAAPRAQAWASPLR